MPTTTISEDIIERYRIYQQGMLRQFYDNPFSNQFAASDFKTEVDKDNYYKYLDEWKSANGTRKPIVKMTTKELRQAIKQVEDGWECLGQRGRLYTLKKVLEKRHP